MLTFKNIISFLQIQKYNHLYIVLDITLPTTVHLVKAMVFPVVMYGCCVGCMGKLAAVWRGLHVGLRAPSRPENWQGGRRPPCFTAGLACA